MTNPKFPLSIDEMDRIRALIIGLHEEIHHPGSWYSLGSDVPDLDTEVDYALQRLTHAIGPEVAA